MNLIICTSPLQMIIAEKIIEMNSDSEFIIVIFSPVDNEKYRYYANRLIKNNKCIVFYEFSPRRKFDFIVKSIYLRFIGFFLQKINKVYVASIDSVPTHFLLSSLRPGFDIYTYDDGTANIDKSSLYYKEEVFSKKMRLFLKLCNRKYSLEKLKLLSRRHFTIFNSYDNIIRNTQYLPLFAANEIIDYQDNKVAYEEESILIGQSVYILMNSLKGKEIIEKNKSLIKKVIKDNNIKFYFPHPKENYVIDNVEYINTHLIFEDYFFNNYSANKKYKIYTFFSGAVFPLVGLENVELLSFKPRDLNYQYDSIYNLLISNGVKVIDL